MALILMNCIFKMLEKKDPEVSPYFWYKIRQLTFGMKIIKEIYIFFFLLCLGYFETNQSQEFGHR